MEAGALELQLPSAGATKLPEIREKLVKLSMDVHALSRRLHPSILDDLGLADAIASECASLRQQHGIAVNYRAWDIPPDVPREIAINLYRIVQEALRNIAKHAHATAVEVTLLGLADSIRLTIKDDGRGLDPGGLKMKGLGLASMKERTSLIRGTFSLLSKPAGGTIIEVTAPLSGRTA
jgi:signal transduction histidine kinase